MCSRCPLKKSLASYCYCLDLYLGSLGKSGHLEACTCRLVTGEILGIDCIDGTEVIDVGKEDSGLDDIVAGKTGFLEDSADVFKGLASLLLHCLRNESCRWDDAELAGDIEGVTGHDGLGVWSYCCRSLRGCNYFIHDIGFCNPTNIIKHRRNHYICSQQPIMIFHLLEDVLRNSILVTGLVVIMMMMIESLNIESKGHFFAGLGRSRAGQILFSALMGAVPGCMGGFASVSLYTHRMISFGALVAMMIASSGDEAFVMLAMVPHDALWIFLGLFATAVAVGFVVDAVHDRFHDNRHCHCGDHMHCDESYEVHDEDTCEHPELDMEEHHHGRHLTWKRIILFLGTVLFITALVTGILEHDHEEEIGVASSEMTVGGINLLSEDWMNVAFALLSVAMLAVLAFASDHFVEEHLWHHIVVKHLPGIFGWTFGVLVIVGILMHFVDISTWISDNTAIMIVLATLIGVIPESGPHMIFVTLYASGIVPLPVLLASCISQDGHASLPLIAESTRSFARAKAVNCLVALAVGFASMLIF